MADPLAPKGPACKTPQILTTKAISMSSVSPTVTSTLTPTRSETAIKQEQPCAPFWNYRARWFLFYIGPLSLLAVVVAGLGYSNLGDRPLYELPLAGWAALSGRDFWVPLLWGLCMPWLNGPRSPVPGMKRIVFRDFNGNDILPLAIPLMHGLIWSICSLLPVPVLLLPLLFAAAFLAYDILMLRYDLLQIHGPKFAAPIDPKGVVKSFLTVWWLYLGIGLTLVHQFGSDHPLAVLGAAALLIAPMLLLMYLRRARPVSVTARRVAVIGAGWSGVYAAKWLLQAGVETSVFERSGHVGGLWQYDEEKPGTVAESTFASSSNYFMHASDFPMRTKAFPTHGQVLDFINDYVDHFGVRDHVRFHSHIESVRKQGDEWVVQGTQGGDGETFESSFDAVVIAGGFNEHPAEFDARYDGFSGEILHSSRYKHVDSVGEHRRILVVGLGESAADVAHECAQLRGAEVYLSGSDQWFAGRFVNGDYPADTLMAPGVRTLMSPFLDFERRGRGIVQMMIGMLWGAGGSGVPEWRPPVTWLHGFVTKSRSAVEDVHEGRLVAKKRISRCEGRVVTFEDGSTVEADLIVDCTGFNPTIPFLEEAFDPRGQHHLVFNRKDPTFSFVGTARPLLGSIPALAEMQARYIAAVYSGRVMLPARQAQVQEAFFAARQHRKRFLTSDKRPNLVDHEFYAAGIAREIGVSVPWLSILFRQPKNFYRLLFTPWMAFKYELGGPNGAQALANMLEQMPKSPVYLGMMKRRFLKMAKVMWAAQAVVLLAILIATPVYITATVGGFFVLQRLLRSRRNQEMRIA